MPHSGAKTRLRELKVREVSLVGKGDNPPARIVLWKGDDYDPSGGDPAVERMRRRKRSAGQVAKDLYLGALAKVTEALGRAPGEDLRKELFEQVREADRARDVFAALMERKEALAESLHSILFFGEEGQDTAALIKETVRQFANAMDDETAGLLSGEIAKAAAETATAPPSVAELGDLLASELEKIQTAGPTRTAKGAPIMAKTADEILAGLTDEDREVMKAQGAATATAHAAEIAKLKPAPATPDPLADVPEPVRKMIEKEREDRAAEVAELRKSHDALQAASERAEFEKTLAVGGLAVPSSEIADLLFDVPAEKRAALVKILGAASTAAELGMSTPLGSDIATDPNGTDGKLAALAAEIRKADPTLTIEQARGEAYEQNPELYVESERERMRAAAASRIQ